MPDGRAALVDAVRGNCAISDARHARDMTMCSYLLAMREHYRWERGIALGEPLPRADVGAWIVARESEWAALEDATYRPLPLDDALVDPFDVAAVNRAIVPEGLVYGAGVGRFGKPQFFVADLARDERRGDSRVLVAGREYARDLDAAPAALREDTIYVRQASLARLLHEKAEAWAAREGDGALKAALEAHGYRQGRSAALERMVAEETETLILHELGEREAASLLGPAWERSLCSLERRRVAAFMRAVRDHLADCLVTLPALVGRDGRASLHLWAASLDGMRRELFPRSVAAYRAWRDGDAGEALLAAASAGAAHWRRVCADVLVAFEKGGEEAVEALSLAEAVVL